MSEYTPTVGEIIRIRTWEDMLKDALEIDSDDENLSFEREDDDDYDFPASLRPFCGALVKVVWAGADGFVRVKTLNDPTGRFTTLERADLGPRTWEPVEEVAANPELTVLAERHKALQAELESVSKAVADAKSAARAKILAEAEERNKAERAKRYEGFPPTAALAAEYLAGKPKAFGCYREDAIQLISILTGVTVEQLKKATQAP